MVTPKDGFGLSLGFLSMSRRERNSLLVSMERERIIQQEAKESRRALLGAKFIQEAEDKRERRKQKRREYYFIEKNNRRHRLIDKSFLSGLTKRENAELEELERWTEEYFAPWYEQVHRHLDEMGVAPYETTTSSGKSEPSC